MKPIKFPASSSTWHLTRTARSGLLKESLRTSNENSFFHIDHCLSVPSHRSKNLQRALGQQGASYDPQQAPRELEHMLNIQAELCKNLHAQAKNLHAQTDCSGLPSHHVALNGLCSSLQGGLLARHPSDYKDYEFLMQNSGGCTNLEHIIRTLEQSLAIFETKAQDFNQIPSRKHPDKSDSKEQFNLLRHMAREEIALLKAFQAKELPLYCSGLFNVSSAVLERSCRSKIEALSKLGNLCNPPCTFDSLTSFLQNLGAHDVALGVDLSSDSAQKKTAKQLVERFDQLCISELKKALEDATPADKQNIALALGLSEDLFRNPENLFKRLFQQHLNKKGWDIIHKKLYVMSEESMQKPHNALNLESKLTPACKMQADFSFEHPYPNGTGVCCSDFANTKHVPTLWLSELSETSQGNLLKTVRHGTLDPWLADCEVDREQGALNRAHEVITAALHANDTAKSQVEALIQGRPGAPSSVTLLLSSVSLMTPDFIRSATVNGKKFMPDAAERDYTRRHNAVWEIIRSEARRNGGIYKLPLKNSQGQDITIPLDLTILNFSLGVNKGAVAMPALLGSKGFDLGGWKEVRGSNQRAIYALLGEEIDKKNRAKKPFPGGLVREYLDKNPGSKHGAAILELSDQIREIWSQHKEETMGLDAYKLVSRIQLLCALIDGVPAINCKSGKDRTSVADAEMKFLAAEYQLTGSIPRPNIPLTAYQQFNFRQHFLASGNLEVQERNVGIPGYKTEGVRSISERLGHHLAVLHRRGFSSGVLE